MPVVVANWKPAKIDEEFAGVHGASNELSAKEWLSSPKWNSTKEPAGATIVLGEKARSVAPPTAAVTVWVLLEPVVEAAAADDDGAAAAAAVGVEVGAGPYICATVRGMSSPIKAKVFEENILNFLRRF